MQCLGSQATIDLHSAVSWCQLNEYCSYIAIGVTYMYLSLLVNSCHGSSRCCVWKCAYKYVWGNQRAVNCYRTHRREETAMNLFRSDFPRNHTRKGVWVTPMMWEQVVTDWVHTHQRSRVWITHNQEMTKTAVHAVAVLCLKLKALWVWYREHNNRHK